MARVNKSGMSTTALIKKSWSDNCLHLFWKKVKERGNIFFNTIFLFKHSSFHAAQWSGKEPRQQSSFFPRAVEYE